MPSLEPVLVVLERLYPDPSTWPKPFRRLAAVRAVRSGTTLKDAAKFAGSTAKTINTLLTNDPVVATFGTSYRDVDTYAGGKAWKLAKRGIGHILLGRVAERAFEQLYRRELGTDDLKLEDKRGERNDTDYRVLNGGGKPVFRINIKMHGTPFRRAEELVGLKPEDCFALGTYKIFQGLSKERVERLPYIFMVATAPNLTVEAIGDYMPDDILRLAALLKAATKVADLGKRDMEEHIADTLVGPHAPQTFVRVREQVLDRLAKADWRALSAERAERLLHEMLWQRVYALRVRGFAQNYPNAELDMHFSLSKDMTPLTEFLQIYKDGGMQLILSKLARGDI